MEKHPRQLVLALGLILLSVALYLAHYYFLGSARQLWIDLLDNLAFLPIQILIVSFLVTQLVAARERRQKFNKLNMVIDAFFSEVGRELMRFFYRHDEHASLLGGQLLVKVSWSKADFQAASLAVKAHAFPVTVQPGGMAVIKPFLLSKREFLLSLLGNPNLLEHERFTDLLWAVFHLMEELGFRSDFFQLPNTDLAHLAVDCQRAYKLLVGEWLIHIRHLQADYPYLFSLAVRANPFDSQAAIVVGAGYA